MGEIIPFPVWIIPFPVLKINFGLLGNNEEYFVAKNLEIAKGLAKGLPVSEVLRIWDDTIASHLKI